MGLGVTRRHRLGKFLSASLQVDQRPCTTAAPSAPQPPRPPDSVQDSAVPFKTREQVCGEQVFPGPSGGAAAGEGSPPFQRPDD